MARRRTEAVTDTSDAKRAVQRLSFANGGWLGIGGRTGTKNHDLLVRVSPDETGRYRVRELFLSDTGEPITADRLRGVRLGAIETVVNLPFEHSAITERIHLEPPFGAPGSEGFFEWGPSQPRGRPISAEELRVRQQRQPPPLVMPAGRGYPDSFYGEVAKTYRAAMRSDNHAPVVAVAESAGVPRSTAGRWVKEARRRGLLGEAQPGKAGDFQIEKRETRDAS